MTDSTTRLPMIPVLLIVGALILLLLLRQCGPITTLPHPNGLGLSPTIERSSDTVERIVYRDRIVLRDVPIPVTRSGGAVVAQVDTVEGVVDTVLLAQPFTAALDTVVGQDTAQLEIAFPPLRLTSLRISSPPDTVRDVVELLTVVGERARPWYEQAGEAVAFMTIGYVTRWITAPDGCNRAPPDAILTRPIPVVTFSLEF